MPVIAVLQRLIQEDCCKFKPRWSYISEYQTSQCYIMRLSPSGKRQNNYRIYMSSFLKYLKM